MAESAAAVATAENKSVDDGVGPEAAERIGKIKRLVPPHPLDPAMA